MKVRAVLCAVIIAACVCIAGCVRSMPADSEKAVDVTVKTAPVQCVYAVYKAERAEMDSGEFLTKLKTVMDVLRTRLDDKGYTDAAVLKAGDDTVRVEIPLNGTKETKDIEAVFTAISHPGLLEFKNSAGDTKLTGADVLQVYISSDERNKPAVAITFNTEGAKLFGDLTADAYNNNTQIIIMLDGKTISTAGVYNGPIYGGKIIIEGDFTKDEANDLVVQIESGVLPLKLEMADSGTGIMSGS